MEFFDVKTLHYVTEEKMRRSLYATFVDKDTGRESLVEKFPEAKEIIVRQHNFQWCVLCTSDCMVVIHALDKYILVLIGWFKHFTAVI